MEYRDVLMGSLLFDGVEESDLAALLGCLGAKTAQYPKKAVVLAQGDRAGMIGLVLRGSVRVEQVDWFGDRHVLGQAEAGELFAETFACAGAERLPVSVVAAEETTVLFIDCTRVLYACSNACAFHQRIIFNLMKVLAQKNLMSHRRLEIAAKRTTRDKLLTYLGQQAMQSGSRSFYIPFDRQELADYLKVDRSGLSAEIGKLKKEGVIDCEKNRFEIKRGL